MAATELLNCGFDAKELHATLGLVPLINRRKLHIVLLVRKWFSTALSKKKIILI